MRNGKKEAGIRGNLQFCHFYSVSISLAFAFQSHLNGELCFMTCYFMLREFFLFPSIWDCTYILTGIYVHMCCKHTLLLYCYFTYTIKIGITEENRLCRCYQVGVHRFFAPNMTS